MFAAIKPEVQGSPESEPLLICTKLIRSPDLTPAQLLGMTLELTPEERLAAAAYGLRGLLKEHPEIEPQQHLQLCAKVVATSNTSRLMFDARSSLADCVRVVELDEQMVGFLVATMAADNPNDSKHRSQPTERMQLVIRLDEINRCLGRKGAHGHAVFIQMCR